MTRLMAVSQIAAALLLSIGVLARPNHWGWRVATCAASAIWIARVLIEYRRSKTASGSEPDDGDVAT